MSDIRPVVWSVAGSDSGAGAGLQADLRAFDAMGVHGCTVVAALTAQNSVGVQAAQAVDAGLFEAQLDALAQDLPPRVVKTGMLGSAGHIRRLARCLDSLRSRGPVALVVDPVRRASTGTEFAGEALRQAYLQELLPRATLVTPNRAEAAWLLGRAGREDEAGIAEMAAALRELGPAAVAITGGDTPEAGLARDWIATPQATGWLSLPRRATRHHHGTGCVHAASAAAALAWGYCEADALVLAKMATTHALERGYAAGQGAGPVHPGAGYTLRGDLLPTLEPAGQWPAEASFAALAPARMGLYGVVDSADWVERVLAAGLHCVQLRIKREPDAQVATDIARAVRAAQAVGARLFINDHWALAMELGAGGVHLGQEDLQALAPADLDRLRASGLRLGISTHSFWEVCRARSVRPSYIACGPIHPTTTKAMPWHAQGEGNLAYWCHLLQEPVVAIGGMDEARARQAMRCGASGVAVLRGIVQASEPAARIARLQEAINQGAWAPRVEPPVLPLPTLDGPAPLPRG